MTFPPIRPLLQAPLPAGTPERGWLRELVETPGAVETLVGLLLAILAGVVVLRSLRLLRELRQRRAVADYLLGVEQALSSDLAGARTRLQRVLEADPENHFAQMLLGQVLAELGEPERAHRHHLTLRSAFGIASSQNALLLARCLLELGLQDEAADVAETAADTAPPAEAAPLWEFLFRVRLRARRFAEAAAAGRRWLRVLPGDADAVAGGRAVAEALARSGASLLGHGDVAAATRAHAEARSLGGDAPAVARLGVRLLAQRDGPDAVVAALLGDGGTKALAAAGDGALPVSLPASRPRAEPLAGAIDPTAGMLAPFLPEGRWRCGACGTGRQTPEARCPACDSREPAVAFEPRLFAPVTTPQELMDAVDENEAFVRRAVAAALREQEREAPGPAAAQVMALGPRAVPELLLHGCRGDDGAVALLRAMGPGIAASLFAAAEALGEQRLRQLAGGEPPLGVVRRVVQGFDRTALPQIEQLSSAGRPEHRRILIDYYLGLGDPGRFETVLERFAPLEILQRLNQAEPEVLGRFLAAVPQGHVLADVLLTHASFRREEDLLLAIPAAVAPQALEQVLRRRGPSRALTAALVRGLADATLQPVAQRLLLDFGSPCLDQVLEAFADDEQGAIVRQACREVLVAAGAAVVERVCAAFGPEPAELDTGLRAVLAQIGADAVPGLADAYGRRGWLERLRTGLAHRHGNRRRCIVQALGDIGGARAEQALVALRQQEADQELRLCLEQALHRVRGKGGAL